MLRFSEDIPKNPAKRKMTNAQSFLLGSVAIKYNEVKIKIKGIILVT